MRKNKSLCRVIAAALMLVLCLSVLPVAAHAEDLGSIKIISLGNSFSADAQYYLYSILKSMGYTDIKVANLFIPGCTLATHLTHARTNDAAYQFIVSSTESGGKKITTDNFTIKDALESDSWDWFTFQQLSAKSGLADTFGGLPELVGIVKGWAAKTSPDIQYAWHMTWAYQQDYESFYKKNYNGSQMTMYNQILSCAQSCVLNNPDVSSTFSRLIPNATAVQNARTSWLGDNLTRDGYHLGYVAGKGVPGRYIAALTFARVLTGREFPTNLYAPDNVNDTLKGIALESVNNAIICPFAITQSSYLTNESSVFNSPEEAFAARGLNRADYDELALFYTNHSWYNGRTFSVNKTSSAYYNLDFTARHDTEWGITRDALPDGSMIYIANGYNWRGDYTDGIEEARPDKVSTTLTEVTDSWWNGHTIRGFNITRDDGGEIASQFDRASEIFRIFVPKTARTGAAASVGETEYTTLADAIAAAETTPTTITLCADLRERVTIPTGAHITIDPNGYSMNLGTIYQQAGSSYNGIEAPEGLEDVSFGGKTYAQFIPDENVTVLQSLTASNGIKVNAAVEDKGYMHYFAYLRWTEDKQPKMEVIEGEKHDNLIVFPLIEKKAKNMGDEHRVTILGIDAAGGAHIAHDATLSIRDYAQTVLEDYIDWSFETDNSALSKYYGANLGRLMAAMLSYGAASQQRFGYETDDLVNSALPAEAAAKLAERYDASALAAARQETTTTVTGDASLLYGASCILGEDIALRFYFRLPDEVLDGLTVTVSYTSCAGEEITQTLTGSELTPSGGYRCCTVSSLKAADVCVPITLTLERGGETLLTATDSVANYTARAQRLSAEADVADAMLIYGLAARAYFTPADQPIGEENELDTILW
ncbi:MAG: DUF4886 domain-containing protein [Oscillospiraceae bacterium]|nr:DUF4886 domain-containing protein [Oscillospiraceae bacterium]